MTSRDEPRILADLIRLHDRNEQRRIQHPEVNLHGKTSADIDAENELIEQARAALARYVAGKVPPKRRCDWYSAICMAAGMVTIPAIWRWGVPIIIASIGAVLFLHLIAAVFNHFELHLKERK